LAKLQNDHLKISCMCAKPTRLQHTTQFQHHRIILIVWLQNKLQKQKLNNFEHCGDNILDA